MKLKKLIGGVWTDLSTHWNRPAKGNYISYKELTAYSLGGFGVKWVEAIVAYIALTANSFLFGSAFGIDPLDLGIMTVISTILGFVLTPLKSVMVDNTRSKTGKFRPYLLWMALPTAVSCIGLIFIPTTMAYFAKVVVLFIFFTLVQFFYSLYYLAYTSLVQVMSPNTKERAKVISISSIIASMAPTITGLIFPVIASFFADGFADIGFYKLIFPVFTILGVILGLFSYYGTKERIVVSKKYVPRVKFVDGFEKIAKNKYFWLMNTSNIWAVLRLAITLIFPWIMQYGTNGTFLGMDSLVAMGICNTILGFASLPGMAFAPLLVSKLGKKNVIIWMNVLYLAMAVTMLFTYQVPMLFLIALFIANFANATSIITAPAIGADLLDYQQYKTGDRLEGYLSQSGALLISITGFATSLVLPFIYRICGLGKDYNILYVDEIRNNIFFAIICVSIIATILFVLPYFLWDLNESKHANIIKVLRVRALFEDYAGGVATEEQIVQTINELIEAQAILDAEYIAVSKEDLKKAKALPKGTADEKAKRKAEISTIKKALSENAKLKDKKASAAMAIDELTKFTTGELSEEVLNARKLIADGIEKGLVNLDFDAMMEEAKAMPKKELKEIEARDAAIWAVKKAKKRSEIIKKAYPNGVVIPDADILRNAVDMPAGKERAKAIKLAESTIRTFNKACKPYILAEKLIKQFDEYSLFDEIKAKYPECVKIVEERDRQAELDAIREAEDKKQELAEIKQERFNKLPEKTKQRILAKRAAKEAKQNAKADK